MRDLRSFWLLANLALAAVILLGLRGWTETVAAGLFALTASIFTAALFLAPGWVLLGGVGAIVRRRRPEPGRRVRITLYVLLAAYLTGTILFFMADNLLYAMYGFHFNGFVVNLLTTRGGIDSLGLTPTTLRSAGLAVVGVTSVVAAAALAAFRAPRRLPGPSALAITTLLAGCGLAEKFSYGVEELNGGSEIRAVAAQLPLYQPLTFRRLAGRLGIEPAAPRDRKVALRLTRIHYPRAPLVIDTGVAPLNVVWITSESMRWDLLSPEVMPATWQLAGDSHRFERHFSGGNRTRMGMFSMFYGLEGPYWFPFLAEGVGPVFIDFLQRRGYDLEMFTSAAFSYPEFDQTIFRNVPAERLHEVQPGSPVSRDAKGTKALLESIDAVPGGTPFMRFIFFESTHAPYDFPEDTALLPSYVHDVDYTDVDALDPELFRNRYKNAAHYVDRQIGRIVDHLKARGLFDSTIIVVTGDHGEAFMEHGRWGHGSDFTDQQIRTPLVIHLPGTGSGVHTAMSSHVDIVPTLLSRMGVTNPVSDYSTGGDLLSGYQRDHIMVSDWSSIAYVDDGVKVRIPLKTAGLLSYAVTTAADGSIADADAAIADRSDALMTALKNLQTFSGDGVSL
ncbi:MAG: sulfatase-like hydrolase/transferase [Pseudomonadales bacterium]